MINDQLMINKSNLSVHKFERFFVKIFGDIENILSAGIDYDCPVKYFLQSWKELEIPYRGQTTTLMDNHSGQFSVYTDIISVHLFHYKIEISFYYFK